MWKRGRRWRDRNVKQDSAFEVQSREKKEKEKERERNLRSDEKTLKWRVNITLIREKPNNS